jgi:hypothetical protein
VIARIWLCAAVLILLAALALAATSRRQARRATAAPA